MNATVCIPWRPTPDRLPAFEKVTSWWEAHGFAISLGDSTHEVFNISAARNAAVDAATTDRVIVADADTIPQLDLINQALELDGVTYPFDIYRYLGEHTPAADEVAGSKFERDIGNSVGGILVTTKHTYWAVGGMDENFRQWGFEDRAFHMAATTLTQVQRLKGFVYAYGQNVDRDISSNNPGRTRIQLYRFAVNQPDLMAELTRCSQR